MATFDNPAYPGPILRVLQVTKMAPDPPSFGSVAYWNERFLREPEVFEWLREPAVFRSTFAAALQNAAGPGQRPQVLHIGCGTSALPFYLRAAVPDPAQIHNTDFSRVAIQIGKDLEREVVESEREEEAEDPAPPRTLMQWTRMDLLSFQDVRTLLAAPGSAQYHIILDKSTSDAIACGDDPRVALPHALHTDSDADATQYPDDGRASPSMTPPPSPSPPETTRIAPVHPLHILALHLAYVTAPGAQWIALSYSQHRFPFLPPYPPQPEDGRLSRWIVEAGLVHPRRLWTLLSQQDLYPPSVTADSEDVSAVLHTLYVLERTSVALHSSPLL